MNRLALGAIGDDYTGSSDLANTLARNGLSTVQTIGVPSDGLTLPDVDAVVVALKSRSVPAGQAVEAASAADRWLRSRGAEHVLFKICSTFDSTDAGNIGPVTEALQAAHGGAPVIVTPAFPETGRTVYQGHLFVGNTRLDESPLKDHPLNPMRDSSLVRTLARQSKRPVGLIPMAVVAAGPEAVRERLGVLRQQGVTVAIADALFEGDLETLGLVALPFPVSTGASGMGLGLARALVCSGRIGQPGASGAGKARVGGYAAILAGSCSQATLGQIDAIAGSMPVLHLDLERLVEGGDEAARAVGWAETRLADGPVVIASSRAPAEVQDFQARHGGAAVGHTIEQGMASIAAGLTAAGVRRLIVAGGETSGAVVDRLGIPAFLIRDEIAAGVPVVETVGLSGAPLLMALKSGNFGGPNFFAKALSMMK
jgi:uncharacterized protein YgbK (DUF1537 family)